MIRKEEKKEEKKEDGYVVAVIDGKAKRFPNDEAAAKAVQEASK